MKNFQERLVVFRKARGLTQQALADQIRMHVVQIRRYEAGASQPTLDVIRKLAIALGVTADELIFGKGERKPDEDMLLQFETMQQFSADEKKVAKSVIEALILKHAAKKWGSS
jgi:transcriptional regulator with XRE-family HTH domain